MTERIQTRGMREFRWVRWLVAAIVGVNVVLLVVDHVLPGPSGEPGSALATTPEGFAAWAELVERNGIEVVVLRDELRNADLPPGATVVTLGARGLSAADARALREHDGRVIDAVPDVRRLQNRNLAEADNAAYALELAGEGPLVFAEGERPRGLAALPRSGKWALGLLCVAALLFMLARGRRFGPPQPPGRELSPPRVVYVDALAAALAKTRDPAGAMEPILRALDRREALPRDDAAALALAREYVEARS